MNKAIEVLEQYWKLETIALGRLDPRDSEFQKATDRLAQVKEAMVSANDVPQPLMPKELQEQHRAWALALFGPVAPYRPVLGIMEELGELQAAIDEWHAARIKDAIADTTVFVCSYCTARGWDFAGVFPTYEGYRITASKDLKATLDSMFGDIAKVAHHQLKTEDGIRGSAKDHEVEGANALRRILMSLESMSLHFGTTLMQIVTPEWNRVRQRTRKSIE